MSTTPRGYPHPPAKGGANNVPVDITALANVCDARPGVAVLTTAERDALGGTELWNWRVIANRTTGRLEQLDLATGVWRPAIDLTNIDAQTLDGLDSTAFLLATGKAADADLLDGIDAAGFARTSHGTHGVSSVNGRGGAVTGLSESHTHPYANAFHGTHGVSSVNGRGGDVSGLAEDGHGHAASSARGFYTGDGSSPRIIGLGFAPVVVVVKADTGARGALLSRRSPATGTSASAPIGFSGFGGSIREDGVSIELDINLNQSGVTYSYVAI